MKKVKSNKETTTSGNSDVKHGYNEKNPGQPQGAFKPDATQSPKKAPRKNTPVRKK